MAFQIVELDGVKYRKNINKNGMCKHYQDIPCVHCNAECDCNTSIDDLLKKQLEDDFDLLL